MTFEWLVKFSYRGKLTRWYVTVTVNEPFSHSFSVCKNMLSTSRFCVKAAFEEQFRFDVLRHFSICPCVRRERIFRQNLPFGFVL